MKYHLGSIILLVYLLYIVCSIEGLMFGSSEEKCSKDYSCYTVQCPDKSIACDSLITYQLKDETILFRTITPRISHGMYVAIGLADKAGMENASVVECVVDEGLRLSLHSSYNILNDKNNIRLPEAPGLDLISIKLEDGTLYCDFSQSLNRVVNKISFNLRLPLYILYASGKVASGSNRITKHAFRTTSEQPFLLTELKSTSIIAAVNDIAKIKAHGSLMIFAWVFLTSCGIIFARYFKHMWPNSRLCGLLLWFQAHRALMLTNVSCTIIAFVLIMVAKSGWKLAGKNPHPIIGLVTFILCLTQPCMALFRCKPDAEKRYIFNWAHWFVGTSAHILSVAAIFLGFQLAITDKPVISQCLDGLMGTFVIFHIATQIILDIHMCIITKNSTRSSSSKLAQNTQDLHLQDMSGSVGIPGMIPLPSGSKFKNIILLVYIFVVFILAISMIAILVTNME